MVLLCGVSWYGTLLLWGCICFPLQKGSAFAHGYSVNDDGLSSHAGVLGPQTSNQFQSGLSLNTNHDSVSPLDEMQAMRRQSFVSPQQEPADHEDASSVASFSEDMLQGRLDPEPDKSSVAPSAPSVQKLEHERSDYYHPFGLLLKEHTEKKNTDGISFPKIEDFKQFIETIKSSFITPGSDISRHFQTAEEIMKSEAAPKAQYIKEEPNTGYRSYSAKEGSAHDDANENAQVWSEPVNAAFEQSEQAAKYQMPSESLSVPDPAYSTASPTSTSDDSQDSGPGSALYPHPHLAATDRVSSNYGGFEYGAFSGENPDIFTSVPAVQSEAVQSTSYKHSDQIPSGSFFGEDFSFGDHATASPANLPSSPSQDFSYYSSETFNIAPLTSENKYQQPTNAPQKDYQTGYQKPSDGFEIEDFQSEELGRVTPADVLSAQSYPFLASYGKSVYVNAPRGQHYIPDHLPKHRERPGPSFQPYQPTVGKDSKDINYTPTVNLPVSGGSASSRYDNFSPQSSSARVGIKNSSPHEGQNQDRSDLARQNLVSAIQEQDLTDNTLIPISGGLHSTQSGIPSPAGVDYESLNSLTNLAPNPASDTAFSRLVGDKVTSRNFGIKNMISNRFPTGARTHLSSISTPWRRGMSPDGGYVSATGAGLLQTFIQPIKVQKHPAKVNKKPGDMSYWPERLSASKVSGSVLSGVFWKNDDNTKRVPPRKGPSMSPPSVKAFIVQSRNGYARSKVSLSKTQYAPYRPDEGKAGKRQWKPAPGQHKNSVSHVANGFEEQ